MKWAYVFLAAIVVQTSSVFGQAVMPDNLRAASTIDRMSNFTGTNVPDFLYGIPAAPGKVIGDTYLNTEFNTSNVLLYENDKIIEGYPVRYDVYTNELEFNAKNGIKVMNGGKVKSFAWIDEKSKLPEYFINAKEFRNSENVQLIGFFQVLSDGALPLLKKTTVDVKKPDYNEALNVGSRDAKILKKAEQFYAVGNKVFKVPASKKNVLSLFADKSAEMEKFIADKSLSMAKEEHLITIFNHYNLLVKK